MKKETFLKAQCYDRRVNWEKRLAREWPFFQKLFTDNRVKRTLDCSCGTGHHAILLARNGYSAWGSDIDEGMILLSRENASKAGVDVTYIRAAFDKLSKTFAGETFDTVISTGNSLGQLGGYHELQMALKNMASVMAPCGILILHILNYARLIEKKVEEMPIRHSQDGEKEILFLKTFRYIRPWIQVDFVDIEGGGNEWSCQRHTGRLLPILPSHLDKVIEAVGLSVEGRFGDYSFSPFDIHNSRDYITVSRGQE